jgi:hypothetical protein
VGSNRVGCDAASVSSLFHLRFGGVGYLTSTGSAVSSDCLDTEHEGSKILRHLQIYLPIDTAPYTEDFILHNHRYENLVSHMKRNMLCVR